MEMVAHGGKPDKGGPPKAVAQDFVKADKKSGKKFSGPEHKALAKSLREKPKPPPDLGGMEGLEGGV
jgi:hypothetical protein